jgi:transcriptional regulator with XRE-family HTH domain
MCNLVVYIVIGTAIRDARRLKRMTQDELAAKVQLSRQYINSIERGGGEGMPIATVARLAAALGMRDLPLSPDLKAHIESAAIDVQQIRAIAERMYRDALQLLESTASSEGAKVLHFPQETSPVRILYADDQDNLDTLRDAFTKSTDAEFRKGFRGRGQHMVARGIDVAAGYGAELLSVSEEEVQLREIPGHYWQLGARTVLRARGNSLIGRGIVDRDLLFIRPASTPQENKIIACRVDDMGYVKIFKKTRGQIQLLSANPEFQPREVHAEESFQCFGIVIGRSGYALDRTEEIR